ncbi:phosphoesterase, partial [Kitasatospora sp. NPDC001225]
MQVTRRRRSRNAHVVLLGRRVGRKAALATACVTAVAVATGTAFASTHQFDEDQVGQTTENGLVISSDQYLAPYGSRQVLDNGKIMGSTVSPDGAHLAAAVTDGDAAL